MKVLGFILIIMLLLLTHAKAQNAKPKATINLVDTAYDNYWHGHYSRAIQLFKQVIVEKHETYYLEALARCYAKTDSLEQEKKVLEIAINSARQLSMDGAVSCNMLAAMYLKEKNYNKALYYYDLYGEKMRYNRFPDRNMHAYYLYQENDRSKCFEGLNMLDSAVEILTPYVFYTYRNLRDPNRPYTNSENLQDSLREESICARYLSLLRKLRSIKEIKTEFKKAEQSFYYTEKITPQPNDYILKEVTTGFTFYGIPIIYSYYGVEYNPKEKQIPDPQTFLFSKSAQFEGFRQLPVCRMMQALSNKN